jgi:uncharacterized membrane protein
MLASFKAHRIALFITVGYGMVFSLMSLVNHYCMRSYGYDLGIYHHGLYSYAHLKPHIFTLAMAGEPFNHLGVHFSPIVALHAPFYYLFGSYTLLIFQVLFILFGGWGVYLYAKERLDGMLPHLILIFFFSMWGIYSALAQDWHANVVGAMLVPWFILFFERGEKLRTIVMFGLILLCKENMALWMTAIVLGLGLKHLFEKDGKQNWSFTVSLLVISIGYFIVIQHVVMPLFNPKGLSDHLGNYSQLGAGSTSILSSILSDPRQLFYLMFESPDGDTALSRYKTELHFMVLVSGGIAAIYRPHYLIMLAPIYAQKMLSSVPRHWGILFHYSIEFAPIIALAMVEWLQHLKFSKFRVPILILFISTATFFNWNPIRMNMRVFKASHYQTTIDLKALYNALDLIPENAAVCASNPLVPHLAERDRIYIFPKVRDAEYVALLKQGRPTYPLEEESFNQKMKETRESATEVIYEDAHLLILKR